MASPMNVTLYGQEVADRMDAVDTALEKVNQEYKAYFDKTPSRYAEGEEKPSNLSEFTILQWNGHRASIGFLPELRQDIAEAAAAAFKQAIGPTVQ
jgi:hypothetical protein